MTELKITQADRQLLVEVLNPCSSTAESIQQGKSYTWEVGQIARHRIAAEEGKAELVREIAALTDEFIFASDADVFRLIDGINAALARVRGEG